MDIKRVAKLASYLNVTEGGSISRVAPLQIWLRVAVSDPAGNVTYDSGTVPSHSFLIQFLEFIYGCFDGANVDATATDGTEDPLHYGVYFTSSQSELDAAINVGTHGIVVGTDDTAETNTDNALGSQLTEGTGSGNITHNVMNIREALETGGNVDLVLFRSFTNNTGSSITVKESGIYCRAEAFVPTSYHCLVRDVLPSPRTVADKCSITIWYTMRTTV